MPSVRTSDPGPRRALAVEPGRIADRLADPLAGQLRHPLGGGARGEAARREQQDLARAPGLAEQGGRDGGGLAGAGRRDEHGVGCAAQRGEQVGQDGVDRKASRSQVSIDRAAPIQERAIMRQSEQVEQDHETA